MPSKSASQARLMAAVAHNPAFAKKVGISQSVGKEFNQADKGRKFKEGGDAMATKGKNPFAGKETMKEEKAEKAKFGSGAAYKKAEKKFEGEKFAKGGAIDGVAQRGKTKGKNIAMKKGGKC